MFFSQQNQKGYIQIKLLVQHWNIFSIILILENKKKGGHGEECVTLAEIRDSYENFSNTPVGYNWIQSTCRYLASKGLLCSKDDFDGKKLIRLSDHCKRAMDELVSIAEELSDLEGDGSG